MVLDLPKDDPFARPPMSTDGDSDRDPIHLARSGALDGWEYAEGGFALIFAKLVAPAAASFAAQRAYGHIVPVQSRKQMITAAAEVFLRSFPNKSAEDSLPTLLRFYDSAATRRNELAHGIVGGEKIHGKYRHFLVPNTWASKKRRVDFAGDYRYSSAQIKELQTKFEWLGGQAVDLFDLLDNAYQSSPEKSRERY